MNYINDTIAAIATAPGNSGISVIRISGDECFSIADKVYRSKSGKFHLRDAKTHTVHYGFIFDGEEKVDEVLATVFYGPRSFTGENTVEISCHGGAFAVKKILSLILKNGARIAEPGEFTKRAFLNGRIDLSQAEAVIDIINSKNNFALKNSINQLSGSVTDRLEKIREKIIDKIAFLEAAMDDPEHYSLDEERENLCIFIESIIEELGNIIKVSSDGKILKEGVKTLILGKPNAGKSSIFNVLLGNQRAIVTDIEGTTRDVIEDTIKISDVTLNIYDTAGIRDTEDVVEKIGVDKALSFIDEADLILFVLDSSRNLDENDIMIAEKIKNKRVIILNNKNDIAEDSSTKADISKIKEIIDAPVIEFSAKNGYGFDSFSNILNEMFLSGKINMDEDIYITNERQLDNIRKAYKSICLVKDSFDADMPEDLLAIDMMDCYTYLGYVFGKQVSDDLADRIFEKFCMGK